MDAITQRMPSRMLYWILLLALAFALYLVACIIYNTFLHPFSDFPGPPLARVSKVWSRYGNLKGRKSHRIHAAHRKYGPVIRVAPNELSFSSPEAVRDIYTNDAFVKEEAFYRAKRVFHEEMLMSFRDPGEHLSHLAAPGRSFSLRNRWSMTII